MRVLVAVVDPAHERGLVEVAMRLAESDEVLVVSVIEVGADRTLAEAQPDARARRRALATLERELGAEPGRVRVHVTVARDGWAAVHELVAKERPELLVVGWRRPGWDFLGTSIDAVLRDPPCDVVAVKGSFARAKRVLVPVRGGRYANLAVRIGTTLARARGGSATLLHVQGPNEPRRASLYQLLGAATIDSVVDRFVTRIGEAAPTIAEELEEHDGIVFGATAREGASDQLGPIGQVIVRSGKPAIVVRTRTPIASSLFLPQTAHLPADRAERSRVISELVDRWFVENTFTSTEFADLSRLVAEKERQGLRISVGLPTLNEEATIAKVIRAIRTRLMTRYPLVDELVVIDSDSHDRTREIAEAEGVAVHIHQRVLPELGAYRGKGEAMWKSLHVLTGDIVVWVDTDVTNIHPKFVYGIVGPLLLRPEISFVKAFYRRPINVAGELQATGGGRVTELSARPILNLFFPELSGMIQPLSGEQGGRRTLLEQLPFFTGYGVEMGLLIDVLRTSGLSSISQVDMKQRIHRNQTLFALSKMSFEILQVALKRVSEARGVLWEDANSTMKLISPEDGDRFHLALEDIAAVERPPIVTVPAYRAART